MSTNHVQLELANVTAQVADVTLAFLGEEAKVRREPSQLRLYLIDFLLEDDPHVSRRLLIRRAVISGGAAVLSHLNLLITAFLIDVL